jgi:hypothetical protein
MFISPKTRFILLYVQFKIYNYLAEKLTKKGRITENLQALNAEINGGGGGVGGREGLGPLDLHKGFVLSTKGALGVPRTLAQFYASRIIITVASPVTWLWVGEATQYQTRCLLF